MTPMPESATVLWNPPGAPAAVECSVEVLDAIRHAALQGLQKLARGGLEEGGVLWGTVANGRLSIAAMRPIECEHARGPSFLLSEADRDKLRAALAAADPELHGLAPLGWWVSHTRSEIHLNPGDLEICNEFFPSPLQATLVVKPALHQPCRATYFLRDSLGAVDGGKVLDPFELRIRGRAPLPGPVDRTPVVIPRREPVPEPPLPWEMTPEPLPAAAPAPRPAARRPEPVDLPRFLTAEPAPPSRWGRIVWVSLLVLAVLGGAAYGGRAYWRWRYPESLGLQVIEREGQLLIEWDRNSSLIREASRAVVQIRDGGRVETMPLDGQQLTTGSMTYARKSGDVEIKLSVPVEDGSTRQETTRFLGQPSTQEVELERLRNRVRELEQPRRGR